MKEIILVQEHQIGAIPLINQTVVRHLTKRNWRCTVISPQGINKFRENKVFSQMETTNNNIIKTIRAGKKIVIFNVGFHYKPLTVNVLRELIKSNRPYLVWCHVNLDNRYWRKTPEFETVRNEHRYYLNHELCRGVLCCSKNVAKSLNNLVKDKGKIAIVYPTVNVDSKNIKNKENCHPKGDLLFAGRLSPEKNVKLLLQAYQKLTHYNLSLKLNIVGEGPEENRLKEISKNLGISQNIQFFKFLPRPKLLRLISNHKVVCLPSQTESFGIVALESLLQGIPVIGSNIEGIREITQNGRAGLLFKNEDVNDCAKKILWAFNNYKILKEKINISREKLAKKYDPEKQLFSLEEIIIQKLHFSDIYLPQIAPKYQPFSHLS